MRFFFLLLSFIGTLTLTAQNDSLPPSPQTDTLELKQKRIDSTKMVTGDSLSLKAKSDSFLFAKRASDTLEGKDSIINITIRDYKIISFGRDTTHLDTTQSIQKEYKFNFLRSDDFELMPFANMGRPYNRLGRELKNRSFFPRLGAIARNDGYFEVEDIDYYHVPTPLTELMFKTTLEEGQMLDAFLTFNTSKQLNFSVAFKGFRSLGKYRFEQVQTGNFRTTFNYSSKNKRYWARGHMAAQDLQSEENGGIEDRSQFEVVDEDNDEFLDRSRIDVRYENANNRIQGRRYYFDQEFKLFGVTSDSLKAKIRKTNLAIGHVFNYETKFYQFEQSTDQEGPEPTLGSNPFDNPVNDMARLKAMFNQFSVKFSNKTLGELTGRIGFYDFQYFFNSILIQESGDVIGNKVQGTEITLGGDYQNRIGGFQLKGGFDYTLSGELASNQFNAMASYNLKKEDRIYASITSSSRLPNFNYLLYQSDYRNFNWQNNFEKQNEQTLTFGLNSKRFGTFTAQYQLIDNYAYFGFEDETMFTEEQIANGEENAFVRPLQETNSITYLKLKYAKEFRLGKWALANMVMYQNVDQDSQVLNLPELVTRNSLYFSSDIFKKAMYVQTGVTFKYFTQYNMNAYNPLLGEFYIQNQEAFGAYPLLDFFINAKVRQTRIFFKAEHINTIWSKDYNYYSAPNYPYRDFVIRFGLVWNFFS